MWLDLFTDDPATWAAGAAYLQVVGPFFAFQGWGCPIRFPGTVLRFVIGVGGAALGVYLFDQGLVFVYACLAAGMLVYGGLTAGSIWLGAWRRRLAAALTGNRYEQEKVSEAELLNGFRGRPRRRWMSSWHVQPAGLLRDTFVGAGRDFTGRSASTAAICWVRPWRRHSPRWRMTSRRTHCMLISSRRVNPPRPSAIRWNGCATAAVRRPLGACGAE
ncbi:MAG: hypothetical protein U5Q16_01895 [Gammaproteobacteria bacterium]|nr:hypothetical protein [Gammaproteobacteria bacterium]